MVAKNITQKPNYSLDDLLPVTLELIPPELLKTYLTKQNPRNRPINQEVVEYFMRVIQTGQYVAAVPDPVVFDKHGNTINAQHRMWAFLNLGLAMPAYVVRGADTNMIIYLDQGRKRSLFQNAHIVKSGHSQKVLTTAKFMYNMYTTLTLNKTPFILSGGEVIHIADKFKEGLEFAERSFGVGNHAISPIKAAIARGYYEFDDREKLFKFGKIYRTGEYESLPGIPTDKQPQFNAVKLQRWVDELSRHERMEKGKMIYCTTEAVLMKFMFNKRVNNIRPGVYEIFHTMDEMFEELKIKELNRKDIKPQAI